MCEVGAEGGVEGALKEEVCHVFFGSRAMGAAQGICPSGSGCLAGGGTLCKCTLRRRPTVSPNRGACWSCRSGRPARAARGSVKREPRAGAREGASLQVWGRTGEKESCRVRPTGRLGTAPTT